MGKYWKFVAFLFIIILLGACRSGDNNDDKPVDTQALINKSADEWNNAESFTLNIRHDGPAPIIAEVLGQPIVFNSAEAKFVSPDRVGAVASIAIGDLNVEVTLFAVGDRQYTLLAGRWCQEVFAIGFDPADLQSSERGIGSALLSIENLEMVGNEEIEGGIAVYHLKGSVETERVRSVTVGMISSGTGNSDIDIFIRRDDTNRLARVIINEINPEDDVSRVWTIDFLGYNQPYPLDEPDVSDEGCSNFAT
jgi:hypothetical protein